MPGCLLLSGVFEGPQTGVELFASCDVPDLRKYGIAMYTNGASIGNNYTFGDGSLSIGQFLYLSRHDEFQDFFGHPVRFNFNKKDGSHRTWYGGIASLGIRAALIFYII